MRYVRIPLLAGAALLAVAPALAVSPPDQYTTFGRDDGIIHDNKTGLDWQRSNTPSGKSWIDAKAYCDGLVITVQTPSGTKDITGFRLPTYKELLTLVDENPSFEEENGSFVLKPIDANAFPQTPRAYFWSATPSATDPLFAWRVSFIDGTSITEAMSSGQAVRCVK